MFKFIFCEYKIHPKVLEKYANWFLLVDSNEALNGFLESRSNKLVRSYFDLKMRRNEPGNNVSGHYVGADENLIGLTMEAHPERKGIVDDSKILDGFLWVYVKGFVDKGHIIVSSNVMSWRHMDETFNILREEQREELVFPQEFSEKDIVVKQWPNGKHWYVRVGNYDLKDKYNTYEEGMSEGRKYLGNKFN